jgi:hypothetical protein
MLSMFSPLIISAENLIHLLPHMSPYELALALYNIEAFPGDPRAYKNPFGFER